MVTSRATALALLAISTVALGACDLLLKIGRDDRYLAANLDCSAGECVCTGGFDDCDGDPDNGCESDVSADAENCGACGNYCNNGLCVDSACSCNAGYADCDGDPSNGCEAAIDIDAENCGACGVSCVGGRCENGSCTETTFAEPNDPASIAAYDGQLYFAGCGDPPIGRTDGVTTESIGFAATGCGALVAVTPAHVFWVLDQDPAIRWADPAIPYGESTFATAVKASRFLLASSTHVYYFANESPTSIRRLRVDQPGAASELVAASVVPLAMAVDDLAGYWSDGDGIHEIGHADATSTLLDGHLFPTSLAASGATLFAADGSGVLAIPLDGSAATQIVTSSSVVGLAADASHVYWADSLEGSIHRAAQDGSDDVTLATGQAFTAAPQLSLDSTSIYWIAGGLVHRTTR